MLKLGLIGKNISHSKSQQMYEDLLGKKVEYHLLDFDTQSEIPPLPDLFKKGFKGLSVTFPYKKVFLNQVEIQDDEINKLDAINCIKCDGGKLSATNTDYLAADYLLQDLIKRNSSSKFAILGSGNMARVFCSVFEKYQSDFKQFSRTTNGDLNKLDYGRISEGKPLVLINCCSRDFVFTAKVPTNTLFWDMNYSFPEHQNLELQLKLTYREGLDLLREQARFALEFWDISPL